MRLTTSIALIYAAGVVFSAAYFRVVPPAFEYWRRACQAYREGEYASSAHLFDRFLALHPNYHPALVRKGGALGRHGDYDAALGCFVEALALRPRDFASIDGKASALMDLGRYQEAIETWGLVRSTDANFVVAQYSVARGLTKLEKLEEAASVIGEAVADGDGVVSEAILARGHHRLGLLLSAQGERRRALASYLRASTLDPANRAVRYDLAKCQFQLGYREQALEHLRRLVRESEAYWTVLAADSCFGSLSGEELSFVSRE